MRDLSKSLKKFKDDREREAQIRLEVNKRRPWLRNEMAFRVLAEDLQKLGFYSKGTYVGDIEKILMRGYKAGRFN